jgi:hypothetical protein
LHEAAARRPAADARHALAVGDDLLDREVFTDVGAGVDRGIEQDLVQDRATRRIACCDAVGRRWGSGQCEGSNVENLPLDWWAARCDDLVQKALAVKLGDAGLMNVVSRQRVAGEARLVEE